jgi:porin
MVSENKIWIKIKGWLFKRQGAAFLFSLASAILITTPGYGAAVQYTSVPEISWFSSWLGQKTFTGDWRGLRSSFEDKGVILSANFTTDIAGNFSGGNRQGSTYAGFFQAAASLNFEKLISLKGWALAISNYVASGNNLSNAIGNFYGVQQIYTSGDYYFGEMDFSFTLPGDKVILEGGRLFAGDVFATSQLWQYYMNGGINGNLISISNNTFFPHFQIATWGTRITYEPDKQWRFSAAAYNANPQVQDTFRHGLDFNFDTDHGCLSIAQVTYKHDQAHDEGLPGSATLGGYYNRDKFSALADLTRTYRGNYGFYFIIDQMLYRGNWPEFDGPAHLSSQARYSEKVKHPYYQQNAQALDRPVGLTAWWSAYVAPKEEINTETYQLAGGLVYHGLIPNRARDATAFCVLYGNFSDKLSGQDAETVFELNHRFQIGPWCYITPNIQYVFNPNGQHNIDNALVLGMEASLNF